MVVLIIFPVIIQTVINVTTLLSIEEKGSQSGQNREKQRNCI